MLSMEKLRIEQILFQIIHQMSLFVVGWNEERKIDNLELTRESIKSGKSLTDLFQWKMRMDFDWFSLSSGWFCSSYHLLLPSISRSYFLSLRHPHSWTTFNNGINWWRACGWVRMKRYDPWRIEWKCFKIGHSIQKWENVNSTQQQRAWNVKKRLDRKKYQFFSDLMNVKRCASSNGAAKNEQKIHFFWTCCSVRGGLNIMKSLMTMMLGRMRRRSEESARHTV